MTAADVQALDDDVRLEAYAELADELREALRASVDSIKAGRIVDYARACAVWVHAGAPGPAPFPHDFGLTYVESLPVLRAMIRGYFGHHGRDYSEFYQTGEPNCD